MISASLELSGTAGRKICLTLYQCTVCFLFRREVLKMARFLACFALFLAFRLSLDIGFNLRLVGASEADPTLLKPDTHEAIVDEKEDSNLAKKSETGGQSNDVSYKYFNYRIANRTDNAKPAENAFVLPQAATANTITSNQAGSGKNEELPGGQVYNKEVSNTAQHEASNQNTQTGAGLQKHLGQNNNSIEKALAFYESILANAKKFEKDSRFIKGDASDEKEKNYADGSSEENDTTEETANVCRSDECKKVSKYIKESLNKSADPCDDFYTFACGGWKKGNNIPESENEITTFTKLTKKIENATHILLNQRPKPGESEALVKARKFFASCMDEEKIEKEAAEPALDFIKSIGDWSMCGNKKWNEKDWDVYKVLKEVQSKYYPAPPFFTVEVTNDHLNSTRHLIKVRIGI